MKQTECRKLLVLSSTYPRWQGDHEPGFVHELASRMSPDFNTTVLTPHASGAQPTETMDGVNIQRFRYAPAALEGLVHDGGIVTNLRLHPWKWLLVPGFLFSFMWNTWRLVVKIRPDAIHAHWLLPQGLVIAIIGLLDRRTPPFLVTSHGADLYALKSWPLHLLKRWVVRRAGITTVVSTPMITELQHVGANTNKTLVQSMGVDLEHRFTTSQDVERSPYEILFVGRLVEKKGLAHLIEAMPSIIKCHPNASLTIVGFGPLKESLQHLTKRHGLADKVIFEGPATQGRLPDYYRRAAVLVAPFIEAANGDQEGLGLVTVEAMGCGCPVIASDLPAVREVVGGFDIATLVPQAASAELADAVIRQLATPHDAARADRIRRNVLSRFSWSKVAARYRNILADMK